jgi:hypothetical protein
MLLAPRCHAAPSGTLLGGSCRSQLYAREFRPLSHLGPRCGRYRPRRLVVPSRCSLASGDCRSQTLKALEAQLPDGDIGAWLCLTPHSSLEPHGCRCRCGVRLSVRCGPHRPKLYLRSNYICDLKHTSPKRSDRIDEEEVLKVPMLQKYRCYKTGNTRARYSWDVSEK